MTGRGFQRSFVATLNQRLKEPRPLIQVILGPRQVGKTTGVQQLSGFRNLMTYVSADDLLEPTADWITEQWQNAKLDHENPILIIDEVQKVMRWSDRIKALWDSEKKSGVAFKLVLLGSSSLKINQGLSESLAGRFEIIRAHHWNYLEFKSCFGFSLEEYLLLGGYPESARFRKNFGRWKTYLQQSIIESIIGKDLLREGSVRKPALFRQTFEILSSYPAQEISYNKILGQIQEGGNIDLVKHYFSLFEGAFLFRALQKYSGSVVRQKGSSPKILPLCPSLYTYHLKKEAVANPEIKGRIFEAAVGAELSKLSGDLFYWRDQGTYEVDFVYVDGVDVFAIEVKSGRKKSYKGLDLFLKLYPKAKPVFISLDRYEKFVGNPLRFLASVAS